MDQNSYQFRPGGQKMQADDRFEAGRQTFARAIQALLLRNDLSHQELKKVSHWANPDMDSGVSTTQISYLRTARLVAAGPRTIDSIGQLNLALARLAGNDWRDTLFADELPPLPKDLALKLASPFFLRHPESELPLNSGDLFLVWIGRLVPADLKVDPLTLKEAEKFSNDLSVFAQEWCMSQNLLPVAGIKGMLESYPIHDKRRRDRLHMVLLGLEKYLPDELVNEAEAISAFLSNLRRDHAPVPSSDMQSLINRLFQGHAGNGHGLTQTN